MANKRSKLNSYKRLLKFLKPYIKLLIISIICMVAVSASNLYVPWIIKDVIDKVLEDKDLTMLYLIIISIIVVFSIRGSTTFAHRYLMVHRAVGDPGFTKQALRAPAEAAHCLL